MARALVGAVTGGEFIRANAGEHSESRQRPLDVDLHDMIGLALLPLRAECRTPMR